MEPNPFRPPRDGADGANASTDDGRTRRADAMVSTIAAGVGAAVWLLVPHIAGVQEAWDWEWYWASVLAVSFSLGAIRPRRTWRFVVALMVPQILLFALQTALNPGALWLIGVLFHLCFAAINVFAAYLGVLLRFVILSAWAKMFRTRA